MFFSNALHYLKTAYPIACPDLQISQISSILPELLSPSALSRPPVLSLSLGVPRLHGCYCDDGLWMGEAGKGEREESDRERETESERVRETGRMS